MNEGERIAAALAQRSRFERTVEAMKAEIWVTGNARRFLTEADFDAYSKHQQRGPSVGFSYRVTVPVRGRKTAEFVAFQDGTAFPIVSQARGATDRSKWAVKEFQRVYHGQ